MNRPWLPLLILAAAACGSPGGPKPGPADARTAAEAGPSAPEPSPVHVAARPPTPKDVLEVVIASGNLPLSTSPTCANVGTEPSDRTIGRYLAGFLAELSSPAKKNWIETTVEPGRSATGEPVSVCTMTIRHLDGDDRWGWGVRFHVRASDGLVLARSFTCVGAG